MFDSDKEDIEEAMKLKDEFPQIKEVRQDTMQTYETDDRFDLITMRWVSGYLSDTELINRLSKWKTWLVSSDYKGEGNKIQSAIIILDNFVDYDKDEYVCRGEFEG